MTATNHALTGAVIAVVVSNPFLAIPLAFLSHFAIDALPHFGLKIDDPFSRTHSKQFRTVLIVDLILASIVGLSLLGLLGGTVNLWVLAACMFAAVSPDLVWGIRYFKEHKIQSSLKTKSLFSHFHSWIQWSETPRGLIVEFVWAILMAGLIFINS